MHHSIRFPEDRARLNEELERMWTQPKAFALIQSSLGIEDEQIAAAFRRLAREAHDAPRSASISGPRLLSAKS